MQFPYEVRVLHTTLNIAKVIEDSKNSACLIENRKLVFVGLTLLVKIRLLEYSSMGARETKPKHTDVVELLTKHRPDILRDVIRNHGQNIRRAVPFISFECPKKDVCTIGGLITAEKGRVYTNPFKHLLSCVANGNESELYDLCYAELENCRRSTGLESRSRYIPNALSASYREKTMYSYLKLIVLKSLPLSIIEDSTLQDFSNYSERFSVKTLKETIFKLVKLVEENVTNEKKTTKGSLMFDGWSECGIHYIDVFAVYMKCSKEVENGIIVAKKTSFHGSPGS